MVTRCTCRPPAPAHYYVSGGGCILVVVFWPKDFREAGAWRT